MTVNIQCNSCFVDLDNGALVYCVSCNTKLSERIRRHELRIANLELEKDDLTGTRDKLQARIKGLELQLAELERHK